MMLRSDRVLWLRMHVLLACLNIPSFHQGGLIKYRLRRQIFKQGFAFESPRHAYEFAIGDSELTCGTVACAGIGKDTSFDISKRTFFFSPESVFACFTYCTSPYFFTQGAVGKGELATKDAVFCVRADKNPAVRVMAVAPACLGFPSSLPAAGPALDMRLETTPYSQATLNLVAQRDEGKFSGVWRHLSCACNRCLQGQGICTSYGPPSMTTAVAPWVRYSVARSPPPPAKQGDKAFIALMVDSVFAGCEADLNLLVKRLAALIRTQLHRFGSVKAAEAYVTKRLNNGTWVRTWLNVLLQRAGDANAQQKAARQHIARRLHQIQWSPPGNRTIEGFVGLTL